MLRICFPFIGDTVGGSHLASLLLIEHLDRNRFQPVIAVHHRGPLTDHLDALQTRYHLLDLPGYLHGGIGLRGYIAVLFRVWPEILRFLRHQDIAVVHGNDLRCSQTWSVPARLAARPLVWHQRTKYAPSRLTQVAMRLSSSLVCISEFCRSTLPAWARARSQVVIDPFDATSINTDRELARRRIIDATNWPDDTRIVGYCGTLSEQKRPAVFVDAAAHIAAAYPDDVRFVLLGSDRDGLQAQLQAQAERLGIADLVVFLGFRHPATDWIAGFDVFLAPQYDDAYGRTLLEAMAVGTPVVASATGGHCEIIEHQLSGLLSAKDDATHMAECALRFIRKPDYAAEVSDRARVKAAALSSVSDHVDRVGEVYQRVTA